MTSEPGAFPGGYPDRRGAGPATGDPDPKKYRESVKPGLPQRRRSPRQVIKSMSGDSTPADLGRERKDFVRPFPPIMRRRARLVPGGDRGEAGNRGRGKEPENGQP